MIVLNKGSNLKNKYENFLFQTKNEKLGSSVAQWLACLLHIFGWIIGEVNKGRRVVSIGVFLSRFVHFRTMEYKIIDMYILVDS